MNKRDLIKQNALRFQARAAQLTRDNDRPVHFKAEPGPRHSREFHRAKLNQMAQEANQNHLARLEAARRFQAAAGC